MGIFLTKEQREELESMHKVTRDKRICDRIKAVLARDDGYKPKDIARILLIKPRTVYQHLKEYNEEEKLKTNNGGSKSKLTEEEKKELIEHLKEITYMYAKDIVEYVKEKYKKKYTISGMTKWLKEQNFCYKKPKKIPGKIDLDKQKEFIREYEKLKEEVKKKGEEIYFIDSVHPQHQLQEAYGWIQKGVNKTVKTNGRQYRVNLMGGINLREHRVIYESAERINTESIISFFSQLRKKEDTGKKIHVILDNAGYHKAKEVIETAKKKSIILHYLPPYSPNLNPIERLWKIMREQVTYNKYYEKFAEFENAIDDFFKNLKTYQTIIKSRINDKFHILKLAPLVHP